MLAHSNHESPVQLVLSCLERLRKSQSGWTACCPAHEDRFPSLKIDEATDGKVLLYCHSGCSAEDIASALGLSLRDLFPPREEGWVSSVPRRSKPSPLPRSVGEILAEAEDLGSRIEIAKRLAVLEPAQAQRDILSNWDYLEGHDIPAVWQLYCLLRGVAMFNHTDPNKAHEPAARRRGVERLVEELSG